MGKYRIADLTFETTPQGEMLRSRAEPYRVDDDAPVDFVLDSSTSIAPDASDVFKQASTNERDCWKSVLKDFGAQDFDLNDDGASTSSELEYVAVGALFFARLLQFDGIVLHASAVVYEDSAYLFSASSGVGKSTHAQLWRQFLGADKTYVLNDDKPALRKIGDRWFVYGSPWAGKSNLSVPTRVPLCGIAFLERANENWIRQISPTDALFPFLNQTLRPLDKRSMTIAFDRSLTLLKEVPIFRLGCLPNVDAARVAYEAMKSKRSH